MKLSEIEKGLKKIGLSLEDVKKSNLSFTETTCTVSSQCEATKEYIIYGQV